MPARHDEGTARPAAGAAETAAGVGLVMPVIFVHFAAADGTEPPFDKATVNGKVWHRAPGEEPDTFRERLAGEARPIRRGCGVVAILK
jgi:hypothetical protein